ncbi:M56 family metallopeptidase [Sphingopyxis sp. JAI128]|uniref:M56 family metallopeptidase n=1 Tax=Sphingopyxis sp. JAI128 TaxID=2723066 RepID=UPI00161767FF|nr:M56 family metallopeptidase [Sphingopyxis sp. JAI128]MBB6424884.1 beta-lactamase regulating signal transducer with metallopeptidase domain [Sphingopyxis sp. JAI128]
MGGTMMTTAVLIGLAWKSVLIAGLTLGLLRLVRKRSAGERSLVAHIGLLALLALPVASLALPQWQPLPASWAAEAAPARSAGAIADHRAATPTRAAGADAGVSKPTEAAGSVPAMFPAVSDVALLVYALPLALLFGVMLLAVVRLFAMRGRAEVLVEGSWLSALAEAQRRMGFKHGTALLVSDELRSPISWGVLRPTIVLSPKAVQAVGEAEAIIAHELAHVARLDWAKLLASRVACALFWFNPLVWMLARESHQLREEAADDAVLLADIDGPDYATLLVGAARHDNQAVLLAAHGVAPGKSSLKRRIARVLDGSLKRGPASASWVLTSLVIVAGITAPLAAFSATAKPLSDVEAPAVAPSAGRIAVATSRSVAATTAESTAVTAAPPKPLSAEDLVSMRAVGVTPDYVAQMREHGGASMTADEIIGAKAAGVDPAYIKTMRGIFPGVDIDELVGASALHIEPGFARDMKRHFPDLDIDDVVALRAMGVDSDFVTEMKKSGVKIRSADDAIELRATGGWMATQGGKGAKGPKSATISFGPGGVIEARGADGRVARVELPEPPAPPAPPGN